jgi:ribosome modulation factor
MTAFDEGLDAFERGVKRTKCPYELETDDAEEWLAGWDEGKSLRDPDELVDEDE